MKSTAMKLPVDEAHSGTERTAWFGRFACVVHGDDAVEVYVSGLLIGSYAPSDVFGRNVLLVGLSQERNIRKGALAAAFGVSDEHRRRLCKIASESGMRALPGRPRGGSEPKLQGGARAKVLGLFAEGHRPVRVFRNHGKRLGVSYTTILRLHQAWSAEAEERRGEEPRQLDMGTPEGASPAEPAGRGLPSGEAEEAGLDEDAPVVAPLRSGKHVQHLGGLLLVATIASFGLYDAALKGWTETARWRDRLRMAFDAVILALGIGQKCVEGVRRLETPTAPLLLRTSHAPSESWVRKILKRYVDGTGVATKLHLRMTGFYLGAAREADDDEPAVFYVDNHMRAYTGKFTLRKGWRMQEKRVVPGVTDYYVHDEDGRPVCRVEAPGHDSLTDFLSPFAELLRAGLDEKQRILLAFDRAGSYSTQMAELRDAGVEFVTYEIKPYPLLARSRFTRELKLEGGETVLIHEERLKNLGKGRGRVRRIYMLTEDGNQVSILAVSKEPAWRLVEIITGRWVQENGFKHGKERWGINQLDRRKRLEYEPGTIIPNPGRRRLDFSIRVSREQEGKLRNKLARLEKDTKDYDEKLSRLETQLEEQLSIQAELIAQRPSLPTHAPVEETELAAKLSYHDPHYKVLLDTIRIAALNAEADLAADMAEHMRKPDEAKKLLANIFAAPGDLRVGEKTVTIKLKVAATKEERQAIAELSKTINSRNLSLPGDPKSRPLLFKSDI
jgi:hypothetical protein